MNTSTKPNQTNNTEINDQEASGSHQTKAEMPRVNLQAYQYLDLDLVLAVRQFVQAWRTQPTNGRITHTKIARALGISNRIVSCAYQALNWKINSSSAESTFDSIRDELTHRLQEFNTVHVGASRRSPEYRQFFLDLCRHYNVAATTMHYWLTAVKLGAEVKAHDAAAEHLARIAEEPDDNSDERMDDYMNEEDEEAAADYHWDSDTQENEEHEEPEEEPKPSDNTTVIQLIKSIERVSVVLIIALTAFALLYLLIKGH
jgi:predicted kinase